VGAGKGLFKKETDLSTPGTEDGTRGRLNLLSSCLQKGVPLKKILKRRAWKREGGNWDRTVERREGVDGIKRKLQ